MNEQTPDATPDDITPDDKDWTWVLEQPCADCGFAAGAIDVAAVGAAVRAMTPLWREVLARPDAAVRRTAGLWSDLEYACHVRDVYRLFLFRLVLMREQDGPHFENWDQDVTAVEDRYGEQDPAVVADELAVAADEVAAAFDDVDPAEYGRTGVRSDGAAFTIQSFARYFLHDPLHHLHDVGAA